MNKLYCMNCSRQKITKHTLLYEDLSFIVLYFCKIHVKCSNKLINNVLCGLYNKLIVIFVVRVIAMLGLLGDDGLDVFLDWADLL